MEQRESLLCSLAQNPQILNDFYQFLEFTRTDIAEQPSQRTLSEQKNQEQQHIPLTVSNKIDLQHNS